MKFFRFIAKRNVPLDVTERAPLGDVQRSDTSFKARLPYTDHSLRQGIPTGPVSTVQSSRLAVA